MNNKENNNIPYNTNQNIDPETVMPTQGTINNPQGNVNNTNTYASMPFNNINQNNYSTPMTSQGNMNNFGMNTTNTNTFGNQPINSINQNSNFGLPPQPEKKIPNTQSGINNINTFGNPQNNIANQPSGLETAKEITNYQENANNLNAPTSAPVNDMNSGKPVESAPKQEEIIPNPQESINSANTYSVLPDNTFEQNVNNIDNNAKKTKSDSNRGKILIIIFIVIILLGGLYAFYNYYLMNPKTIITNETKKLFGMVEESVNKIASKAFDFDMENDSVGIEGKLSLSSDYKDNEIDLTKLKNYQINYNSVIDKSNNKLSGNLAIRKGNNKIASGDIYMYGKDILLKMTEIYSKTLKYSSSDEIKDMETTKSLNYESIKTIINKTEDIVLSSIDEKEISKKLVQKEINSKKDYYMEITYNIDTNKYMLNIIDGYLNDEEVMQILAELNNSDITELKNTLSYLKESIEKTNEESEYIKIVFYIDKITGNFKEADITYTEKMYIGESVINIAIYKDNEIYHYEILNDEIVASNGSYDVSKKELTMNSDDGLNSTKLVIKMENDTTTIIEYNTNYSGYEGYLKGYSMSILVKIDNEISSTSQTTYTNVTINYKQDNQDINAEINNVITISKDKKPVEINSKDYVEIESLTESDMEEIKMNAMNLMQTIIQDFVIGSSTIYN